ncbi:CHRD domain-containing protein [Planctomyces sp. SH-PL62]|uniref:CHRD domain-containing protein n=1 Tax=Planctomyces sp. SH-PL62 TaxID=1636152 RepID=UPI00078C473D|nr:CHRD domain-containing protein [Planctomyces sp. SH-PL62]AMV36317.1 CHRD domain protein [Planctomyces sp. SH-PL62]
MKPILASLVALGLLSSAARADFIATATLSGSEETPPNASAGLGFATLVYESASDSLAYSVTFDGLSEPLVAAHIHIGGAGVAGPIIFPFSAVPSATSGTFAGILTESDFILRPGASTFAEALAAIQAGDTYINLHTSTFPGGEIRGQLQVFVVPEPTGLALLGLGGAAVGAIALRRRPFGV